MSSAVIHSAMSRTRNWATLPVLFLAVGPTIARAAATAFLAPKVKPSSVAQTAHCVRIIVYVVKALGGSPTMQNACKKPRVLKG